VSVAGANDVLDEQQSSVRDAIAGRLGYAIPASLKGGDGKFARGAFEGLGQLLGQAAKED